jgi:hypothetical protein
MRKQVAEAPRAHGAAQQAERIWWSALPVLTAGLLSPVPFLRLAAITRRRAHLLAFHGYFAVTAASWLLLAVGDREDAAVTAGAVLALLGMGTATVHSWFAYRVGRTRRAGGGAGVGGGRGLIDPNRADARTLVDRGGLSLREARAVLAARERLGRFSSALELEIYAELAPGRMDELGERFEFRQ